MKDINDIYDDIHNELENLNLVMDISSKRLASEINHKTLPMLEQVIRLESIINLSSYTATGARPRHSTIREAFDIMASLVGFQYNPTGSFIHTGATDAYTKDVRVQQSTGELNIEVIGRLADLEEGIVNWHNLKMFFYSKWVRAEVEKRLPTQWKSFYNRLSRLFKYKKDPTMPKGRWYITAAVEEGILWLDEKIRHDIDITFKNKGQWL
ncbi:hypothetical protein LCGC14_1173160 [marine sediment metagenome]|uniref:Uncharacterized protein n=1 Tax=marine sediment metagenome TaxID=412755 RepID=A0A0F9PUS2_9ZZZZ